MSEMFYPGEAPVDLTRTRKIIISAAPPPAQPDVLGEGFDADEFTPPAIDDGERALAAASTPATGGAEQLLDAAGQEPAKRAQWGHRGRINRLLGLRLAPSQAETADRLAHAALTAPLRGRQVVMVANAKGGQGKTTTALLLANTFATTRRAGAAPVVWDNAEAEGTLGYRANATGSVTVWDLLAAAESLTAPAAQASALSRLVRTEPSGVEIIASDDCARRLEQITAEHCRSIDAVLRRWRELVIVDTGNNRRRSNWLWTAYAADVLVIPLVYDAAAGMTVLKMLAALREHGLDRLAGSAVAVITGSPAPTDAGLRAHLLAALAEHGIDTVAEIPYDPVLARGGRIDYQQLGAPTRRAWTVAAGHVAARLAAAATRIETTSAAAEPVHEYPAAAAEDAAARIAELEAELERVRRDRYDTATRRTG
ncbi:hypothetical protein FOS14_23485 [Skermania sp. ID1734]|uniref:hypothetical protein n=1 Tax=Skermania sp. ID1734 TaxID=2597516 RepID=UPI00117CD3C1|nr:hypothetical protein [Skermania sp. ID1734]TSD93263.1 hypothetical protein FOS14_23485 [Skermania sp. ID1734]